MFHAIFCSSTVINFNTCTHTLTLSQHIKPISFHCLIRLRTTTIRMNPIVDNECRIKQKKIFFWYVNTTLYVSNTSAFSHFATSSQWNIRLWLWWHSRQIQHNEKWANEYVLTVRELSCCYDYGCCCYYCCCCWCCYYFAPISDRDVCFG